MVVGPMALMVPCQLCNSPRAAAGVMVVGPMALMVLTMSCLQTPARPAASGWVSVPLLTREAKAAGIHPGGEGGQWPRGPVAVSPADPRFLLLPIDVGGVYRSLDGGRHWQIAMVGWNARGANAFAIDPRNPRRAIGVGGNSLDWNPGWGSSPHGLYLTTDQAASWRQTLALDSGHGGAVAYDPRSYDRGRRFCAVAYYLSPERGVYRSQDGGASWSHLRDSPEPETVRGEWALGGDVFPRLAVDPVSGAVCVAGARGLWRSTDRGASWERLLDTPVTSVATTPAGALCITGPSGVARSDDGGRSWRALRGEGLETGAGRSVRDLAVSPADPRRMLCWVAGKPFEWPRFVSWDGGATWRRVRTERGPAPLPMNAREGRFAWHPSDPNVAWCLGGDWVTRSEDGGRTFHWSSNGYAGIMVGGLFGFSVHAPNALFLGFQDYNGALTADGGATWLCPDVSGKGWGGHIYGGFTVDGRTLWGGDAEGWGSARRLRLSRDGGRTWATVVGRDGEPLVWAGPDVSYADPADPRVLFASNLRSADGGATWSPMAGCDGVFTHGLRTRALYGRRGDDVVRSRDHGATWERLASLSGGFDDLAVDGGTVHGPCWRRRATSTGRCGSAPWRSTRRTRP